MSEAHAAPTPSSFEADAPARRSLPQRLSDLLTEPTASVVRPEARRRARTLASILLFLLVAAVLLTWVMPWIVAPAEHDANQVLALTGFASVGAGLVLYAMARTRYHETAAILVVLTTMATCALAVVSAQGSLWAEDAPYFLALSVILSSILLPLSATFFVVAGNLVLLAVLDRFLPTFQAVDLSNSVAFIGFVSVLLIIAAYVRQLDLRQIRDQADELAVNEERYRSLFEATFEGIVLHREGEIVEANQALSHMVGIPQERLVGRPLDHLFESDSRPHIRHKTMTSAHETHEARALRADGTRFPVEFVSKPYLHRGVLMRATALRDISERKDAEAAREKSRELAAANRRLQEVDRLKTHLLNTASHELNTPITPLRLQVHLLKEGRLGDMNERQARAVGILHRNLARLDLLVKDMLDVSRLQSGRFEVRTKQVELNALLADALESYADMAGEQSISVEHRSDGDVWLQADPDRILQVCTNLLSNALKFTPPDGHITVESRLDDEDVLVQVKDDGLGLTPAQRSVLFQPFGQAHKDMQRTERGSGLGLYICKGIIERHGGCMGVASDGPGKGSTFWFRLPIDARAAASTGAAPPSGSPSPPQP